MNKDDKLLTSISRFLDTSLTMLSLCLAYFIKVHLLPIPYRGVYITSNFHIVILMVLIIWHASFNYSSLSSLYFRKTYIYLVFSRVCKIVTIDILILFCGLYLSNIADISRIMILIFYCVSIILLTLSRLVVYKLLSYLKRKKSSLLNVLLVVGSKMAAKDLLAAIERDTDCQFKVLGCLDIDEAAVGKEVVPGVKVIGKLEQLRETLTNNVVDEVIFAMPVDLIWNAEEYFDIVQNLGVQIRVMPHWHLRKFLVSRPHFYSMDFEDFLTTPTFVLSATPSNRGAMFFKAAFDFLICAVVLILLMPFFLIIACLIKISSPGPVFFRQVRSGLNGHLFTLYKFRTMVQEAEGMLPELLKLNEASGPVFKMKNDPRIIPVLGTFLRKTSLDEFPQLINVLRGDMSLIGPRPPIPEEVTKYQLHERRRLSMKPGVTCLWQIQPNRNEIAFSEWMELDLQYIDNWSLWLDFKIFCKTVVVVLSCQGR